MARTASTATGNGYWASLGRVHDLGRSTTHTCALNEPSEQATVGRQQNYNLYNGHRKTTTPIHGSGRPSEAARTRTPSTCLTPSTCFSSARPARPGSTPIPRALRCRGLARLRPWSAHALGGINIHTRLLCTQAVGVGSCVF